MCAVWIDSCGKVFFLFLLVYVAHNMFFFTCHRGRAHTIAPRLSFSELVVYGRSSTCTIPEGMCVDVSSSHLS